MKKTLCAMAFVLVAFLLIAEDYQLPGKLHQEREFTKGKSVSITRTPPAYTFSRNPTSIITSYYDFMIGSYNALPLQVIPSSAGGGYFMTYHGRRAATGQRRVFYSHLTENGVLTNNVEISYLDDVAGYPTIAVDPVSGKPFYAWHVDVDSDTYYEVLSCSDAFLSQISGLFNDLVVVEDAPLTVTPSNAATTYDNEFIWPSAVIGPSPLNGKRRIYIVMRNDHSHTEGPCENAYLRFADFDATDVEYGNLLNWNTSNFTIPELDNWNHDDEWRRPFYALTADNSGNIYYVGYHTAYQADGFTQIIEPDLDVFKCDNYGLGTWNRISSFSNLPTWNPPSTPTSTSGYFTDSFGVPYTDDELSWVIVNSNHHNAILDDEGKIHVAGLWGLENADNHIYPELQFMKEFVFDPATSQFNNNDIYPQVNPDNIHDSTYQPWDTVAPWGIVDEYVSDPGGGFHPDMATDWNFPYWDSTAHDDNMICYYNNVKMTEGNGHGMLAVVWQNTWRALQTNIGNPLYAAYANTPEIFIAVSPDNGGTWSEPIVLNNVQTPEMSNLKPMWVYPANIVKYVGMQGDHKVGKLGLMFYNDYTWGSNVINPPVHYNVDGGQVMFMELQIEFPIEQPINNDPFPDPVALSDSMAVVAQIGINGVPATFGDIVAAFVNVNGQEQLRGKASVDIVDGIPLCQMQIQTETNGETIYFRVWDYSAHQILDANPTLLSIVQGTVGFWPDGLFQIYVGNDPLLVCDPIFSPPYGTYTQAQAVSIHTDTPDATIHFTTDGSIPNVMSSVYSIPIILPLNSSHLIRARAYKSGWSPSGVVDTEYLITGTVNAPTFDPPEGTYNHAIDLSIYCDMPESTIHYTLDGTVPNLQSPQFSDPIHLTQNIVVRAIAIKLNWENSPIATANYQVSVDIVDEFAVPAFTGIHSIYPNPFREKAIFKLGFAAKNQPYSMVVYNIRGE